MTGRCVILGDVMMDISAVIDADIAYASDTPASVAFLPGGVAANTSAWMAMDGHPVTVVGAVGADVFGRSVRARLTEVGVDVHLTEGRRPTGACVIIVDRRRERTMFPDTGANTEVRAADVVDILGSGDHLHVSGYTLVHPDTRSVVQESVAHARSIGATCSLDPASAAPIAAHRTLFTDILPQVDVLLANELEAAALTGEEDPHLALALLADLVPCAVVKLGSRGAIARSGQATAEAPSPAQVILDTTGAGDAFTAGFLPAWREGASLGRALERGQAMAARAVGRVGASPLDP